MSIPTTTEKSLEGSNYSSNINNVLLPEFVQKKEILSNSDYLIKKIFRTGIDMDTFLDEEAGTDNRVINQRQYPIITIVPREQLSKETSSVLKNWEGYVIQKNQDFFTARIRDLKGNDVDEEAEFYYDDVSEDDKELISEGAVFYWSISYLTKECGTVEKKSVLRFRRLPLWSKEEIEEIYKKANEYIDQFNLSKDAK